MSSEEGASAVARDRWHEALLWHTHLSEASDEELQSRMHEWREWEAQDDNRRVFHQLSSLLELGAGTRKRLLPAPDDIHTGPSERTHLTCTARMLQGSLEPPKRARRHIALSPRIWFFGVAAAIAATLLSVSVPQLTWHTAKPVGPAQVYATAVGEVRTDQLADGSTVTLGAHSQISVQYTHASRAVKVDSGEAWFRVTHNRDWPFVVMAGDRSITAVGTAFVVQKRPDQVIVTVTEGSVEVAPGSLDEVQPLIVRAIRVITTKPVSRVARGEQIAYGDAGSASIVEHVDPQAATGWTEGQLEFDHVPLWSAVQVLNRYSPRIITVDQFSGNQIVTGLVLQNQIEDWVRSLPGVYPVDVTQSSNTVCVRARERDSNYASNCGDQN